MARILTGREVVPRSASYRCSKRPGWKRSSSQEYTGTGWRSTRYTVGCIHCCRCTVESATSTPGSTAPVTPRQLKQVGSIAWRCFYWCKIKRLVNSGDRVRVEHDSANVAYTSLNRCSFVRWTCLRGRRKRRRAVISVARHLTTRAGTQRFTRSTKMY